MDEVPELIVEFRPGTSEANARRVVEAAGATVRRKMRSDGPEQLLLLVRAADHEISSALSHAPEVLRIETNHGGYHPLGG